MACQYMIKEQAALHLATHLNMRVAWHERVDFLFGSVGHHEDQILEVFLDLFDFLHLETPPSQQRRVPWSDCRLTNQILISVAT